MRQARVADLGSGSVPDDVSGADVVVVSADDSARWGELIRDRAPNAVVVVVGSPQQICETTLFPRARIIGVPDRAAADVVVDAVVHDLGKEIEVVARCEGERGIEGDFASVPVRVGARGILEIVDG